jgi:predicted nucleotidyltransferase component of viral defense system
MALCEDLPRGQGDAAIPGGSWVTAKETKDRSASVRARLLKLARERGEDFQITLRNYLFERFLYRLGRSELRGRFVLKGAILLRLWADQPYRATVDLDLLSSGHSDPAYIIRDIAAICRTEVPDDAVLFDASTITAEQLRVQEEYAGARATFEARLGTIRERLQVDIGFGDALWPPAEEVSYPVALGDPAPLIHVYRPETVIAEKLEAIVSLGVANSRIKDFFDIDYLVRTERFDRAVLIEAVRRTFARRETPIPSAPPIGLTAEFWSLPGREAQIRAFSRRARLETTPESAAALGRRVAEFAIPILQAASRTP